MTHGTTYPTPLPPAVLAQVEECRRDAAELLDRARNLAATADAAIAAATDHLAGAERRDVSCEEFEAAGVHPLMATMHEIGSALIAVVGWAPTYT